MEIQRYFSFDFPLWARNWWLKYDKLKDSVRMCKCELGLRRLEEGKKKLPSSIEDWWQASLIYIKSRPLVGVALSLWKINYGWHFYGEWHAEGNRIGFPFLITFSTSYHSDFFRLPGYWLRFKWRVNFSSLSSFAFDLFSNSERLEESWNDWQSRWLMLFLKWKWSFIIKNGLRWIHHAFYSWMI